MVKKMKNVIFKKICDAEGRSITDKIKNAGYVLDKKVGEDIYEIEGELIYLDENLLLENETPVGKFCLEWYPNWGVPDCVKDWWIEELEG